MKDYSQNTENRNDKILLADSAGKVWIVVLYVCSFVGFLIGLIGFCLNGLAYFGFVENNKEIKHIGTWLIVLAVPLVMIGAYALEKIGKIDETTEKD